MRFEDLKNTSLLSTSVYRQQFSFVGSFHNKFKKKVTFHTPIQVLYANLKAPPSLPSNDYCSDIAVGMKYLT